MPTAEELIASLESPEDVDAAVEELTALGQQAFSPLTQAILDSSRPPEVRALCAEVVGDLVPDGVEWLLNALSSQSDEAADLAAWGLRWNKDPQRIETALFDLASSPTDSVRLGAARALQFIYVDLQGWDPVIFRLTSDPDERVRLAAMELLVELAEADALLERLNVDEVTPIVELAAEDESHEVRSLGGALGLALENGGS